MITIERRVALLFRQALRRGLDRPAARAESVPVLLRQGKAGLRAHARDGPFALVYDKPGRGIAAAALALPASALAAFEGRGDDPVALEPLPGGRVRAVWTERGETQQAELPALALEQVPDVPALPATFAPQPPHFLAALHEAALTTAREGTRFALQRVLLRGKAGAVVASDGRQLLAQAGYAFPFSEDILVPRTLAFGAPAWPADAEVGVGRTATQVAVRVGAWTVALEIDLKGRYPEVASLLKPALAPTRLRLHPQDAEGFLGALERGWRGAAARELAVALELGRSPALRFEVEGAARAVALPHSEVHGPEARVRLNLAQFLRALQMRFGTFEVQGPDKPVRARDGERMFVLMPLSLPKPADLKPAAAAATDPVPAGKKATGDEPVTPPVPEPKADAIVLAEAPPAVAALAAPPALRAEAEGLRDAVLRAAGHAGRLLRLLWEVAHQPAVVGAVRRSLALLAPPEAKSPAEGPR
jgi:hypothetical protein